MSAPRVIRPWSISLRSFCSVIQHLKLKQLGKKICHKWATKMSSWQSSRQFLGFLAMKEAFLARLKSLCFSNLAWQPCNKLWRKSTPKILLNFWIVRMISKNSFSKFWHLLMQSPCWKLTTQFNIDFACNWSPMRYKRASQTKMKLNYRIVLLSLSRNSVKILRKSSFG